MALFARKKPKVLAAVPEDTVVYAVGDIHGRLDLLEKLLSWVEADFQAAGPGFAGFLIFLGDYVDRGPNSSGVIERLSQLSSPEISVVALRGNHEQMLLDVLSDSSKARAWARVGGQATLDSYGITPPPLNPFEDERWAQAVAALKAAMPAAHLDFLNNLKTAVEIGDYFFVHAGVRPDRPLDQQRESDMLWIRDPFLKHKGVFERVIVHGHSTAMQPVATDARIGIDTGAYATGVLSCLRLSGGERRLVGLNSVGATPWPL